MCLQCQYSAMCRSLPSHLSPLLTHPSLSPAHPLSSLFAHLPLVLAHSLSSYLSSPTSLPCSPTHSSLLVTSLFTHLPLTLAYPPFSHLSLPASLPCSPTHLSSLLVHPPLFPVHPHLLSLLPCLPLVVAHPPSSCPCLLTCLISACPPYLWFLLICPHWVIPNTVIFYYLFAPWSLSTDCFLMVFKHTDADLACSIIKILNNKIKFLNFIVVFCCLGC